MAAKVPMLEGETTTATMMSFGYHPEIAKWSPFHGAVFAVVESLAKIVAAGGDYKKVRLTFQEYFERLGTNPEKWGKPFAALIGAFKAQMEMGVAAIGGKDSMSGTFEDMTVPPTLVSFAVDYENVKGIISPEFKKAGNKVVFLPARLDENHLPDYEYLKKIFELVHDYIQKGICVSAYTVKSGGIAEAISKMTFGNFIGVQLNDELQQKDFFQPEYGSFVLELVNSKVFDFKGADAIVLGETIAEPVITYGNIEIDIKQAAEVWQKPLESVFPTKTKDCRKENITVSNYNIKQKVTHSHGIAKPRVFIPVFPGTNCEYDSKRAFEKAGAEVETLVIANLSVQALEQTIQKMEKMIRNAQMIMLPGGFSAGDEPEGSGKFIAATFRNPAIKDAVMDLLQNRDGLMLGICNGFQALIKLGLVPYGEIRDIDENSPTLTYNQIGRHISCLVDTKITSNLSPWLWSVEPEDVYTIPVSHGEGRFVAPQFVLEELAAKGQIATQYVDPSGKPTYDIRYNPNGSAFAIEGITSPDGRVFGKMGHSERIGNGLYKNVAGEKDQKIFLSGVNYFK